MSWRKQADQLVSAHTTPAATAQDAASDTHRARSTLLICHYRAKTGEPKHRFEPVLQAGSVSSLGSRQETLAARALRTTSAERHVAELQAELANANARRAILETDLDGAKTQLAQLTARAIEAEEALAEIRTALSAQSSEAKAAQRRAAAASSLCDVAQEKLSETQVVMRQKESQIQELEQAQTKLVADCQKLVSTSNAREAALVHLEDKVAQLSELLAMLDKEMVKNAMQIKPQIDPQLRNASDDRHKINTFGGRSKVLLRDLEKDDWLFVSRSALSR